jgi:SpoVK/Ycf46/Vps4 family AAA+-type ATPase
VPPPDLAGRVAIFAVHTRCMPLAPDVDLDYLAQQGDGFTGATIAACCREAALAALEEDIEATCVAMHHFNLAVDARKLQQSDHGPQSLPESFG